MLRSALHGAWIAPCLGAPLPTATPAPEVAWPAPDCHESQSAVVSCGACHHRSCHFCNDRKPDGLEFSDGFYCSDRRGCVDDSTLVWDPAWSAEGLPLQRRWPLALLILGFGLYAMRFQLEKNGCCTEAFTDIPAALDFVLQRPATLPIEPVCVRFRPGPKSVDWKQADAVWRGRVYRKAWCHRRTGVPLGAYHWSHCVGKKDDGYTFIVEYVIGMDLFINYRWKGKPMTMPDDGDKTVYLSGTGFLMCGDHQRAFRCEGYCSLRDEEEARVSLTCDWNFERTNFLPGTSEPERHLDCLPRLEFRGKLRGAQGEDVGLVGSLHGRGVTNLVLPNWFSLPTYDAINLPVADFDADVAMIRGDHVEDGGSRFHTAEGPPFPAEPKGTDDTTLITVRQADLCKRVAKAGGWPHLPENETNLNVAGQPAAASQSSDAQAASLLQSSAVASRSSRSSPRSARSSPRSPRSPRTSWSPRSRGSFSPRAAYAEYKKESRSVPGAIAKSRLVIGVIDLIPVAGYVLLLYNGYNGIKLVDERQWIWLAVSENCFGIVGYCGPVSIYLILGGFLPWLFLALGWFFYTAVPVACLSALMLGFGVFMLAVTDARCDLGIYWYASNVACLTAGTPMLYWFVRALRWLVVRRAERVLLPQERVSASLSLVRQSIHKADEVKLRVSRTLSPRAFPQLDGGSRQSPRACLSMQGAEGPSGDASGVGGEVIGAAAALSQELPAVIEEEDEPEVSDRALSTRLFL